LRAKRLVVIAIICELFCSASSFADPNLARTQLVRAKKLIDHGHYQEALILLGQTIRMSPNEGLLYQERGALEVRMESREDAEADLRKAVSLNPTLAGAHAELARCLFEVGKQHEAIPEITKAIKCEKRPTDIANRLATRATMYLHVGSAKAAFDDINTAIKIRPESIWLYSQRAEMNFFSKNYQNAVDDYTRVLDWKNPSVNALKRRDDWFEFRARCYEKLGKKDLAKKDRTFATKELRDDPYFNLLTPTDAGRK
jgi:tetratricopeptide (TPR) repeat protein